MATSTQLKIIAKKNIDLEQGETEYALEMKDETPDTRRTQQRQALAKAISSAMSKCLEPLLAVKKKQKTKARSIEVGARDGNADGWMMLMKRHLEKALAKATPLDKAWTIIEYLEHEARDDYITEKSEAERKEIQTKKISRC